MTDDLDQLLERLATRPPHPRLDAVTANLLDRLEVAPARRRESLALTGAVAALLAAGMGVAGGLPQPAEARPGFDLDLARALAPSTLLGGS